jgi:NADPH-dependent curcumin reductase CurA
MNRRIVLRRRPVGWVDESCFRIEACAEPECGPEDVRLQALYLSTDPYLRGRMNAGPSYAPGVELGAALAEQCPSGIDLYFDNVGGRTLEAALRHANVAARFAVCGMISAYNATGDEGIRGLQAVLTQRIQMSGFIIYDHLHKLPSYQARVAPWLGSGELVFHEDIVQGFEQAPAAWIGMMKGEAIGKRLAQVAEE